MINYKFSCIFINFNNFLRINLIPFEKIFENSGCLALSELLFLLTEHAISCFLEIFVF